MSMHLVHPSLSTTGKKKGKKTYKSADAAARSRELNASWEALKTSYGVSTTSKKKSKDNSVYNPPKLRYRGQELLKAPSLCNGVGSCAKQETPVYSGDAMIGIGQLHKSNSVPIFKQEDAVDIARMRR